MKIIIFGAAGEIGSRVVVEAVARGHRVTAVVRKKHRFGSIESSIDVLVRDVNLADDLTDIISKHDLVISALRPPDGNEPLLLPLTQVVVDSAREASVRFIVVGGAAVLNVSDAPGHTVLTAPGFLPEAVVPIARACQQQYEWCIERLDSLGTYISPPAMLVPGSRTARYRFSRSNLVVNRDGESRVSIKDFAVAMLDEAEQPQHTGISFTVGY